MLVNHFITFNQILAFIKNGVSIVPRRLAMVNDIFQVYTLVTVLINPKVYSSKIPLQSFYEKCAGL